MVSVELRGSLPNWGKTLINVESVDELAKKQLQEIPERYIRSHEERCAIPTTPSFYHQFDIPVVDMAKIAQPQHRQEEITRIAKACEEWGFFQVVNHGISHSLIDSVKRAGKEFFQLPLEKKRRIAVRAGDLQGYGQTFVVSEDQKLDWANLLGLIISPTQLRDMSMWPIEPAHFRESVDAYNAEIRRLAVKLLVLIAETLQLPPDFFDKNFDDPYQKMRMNYYPPCLRPDLVIGLSAHADMTGLTLLLQDDEVEGLQINKDGQWISVQPIPYALVINIGNLIEVMTNGRYKSIEHRAVVNKEKARLSIGVFYAPGFNKEIGPAPQLIDETHPCVFRKFIHHDYIQNYFSRRVEGKNSLYEYASINNSMCTTE